MNSVRHARILKPDYAEKIYDEFDRQIDEKVKPLIKRIWRANLKEHAGTQIIRYSPHGHYEPHTDSGLDLNDRYFSVLCYRAVPTAGRAIVFPSRYMHCAEPVVAGEKFVVLTWVMGPFPVEWI